MKKTFSSEGGRQNQRDPEANKFVLGVVTRIVSGLVVAWIRDLLGL